MWQGRREAAGQTCDNRARRAGNAPPWQRLRKPSTRKSPPIWKQNTSTSSAALCASCSSAASIYGGIFDYDAKAEQLLSVDAALQAPDVWSDPKRAQELGREKKILEGVVHSLADLHGEVNDHLELWHMSSAEGDDAGLTMIAQEATKLQTQVAALEFRRMFNQPADPSNCFLDFQAGAGGTEACDWCAMLLRQYLRYAERKGFKATVEDETAGDVAGVKSATIKMEGEYAFGLLRTETGVHRLVRKSPFDASGGRHTSFASVFVYPEVDDNIAIDINPADVRTDTFRASGAGGQHINKTDSAVRLTHMPTGIVVQCQDGRSQHSNRDVAWRRLRSRLYDFAMRKQLEEQQKQEDAKTDVGWGHQIRSYVLDQSRIKDLRTGVEISNTQKVLDGDLDAFIEAALKEGV